MKQKLNEELSVGDIYRKEGTEASNSHEVEIVNVFGNVLVVKIIGSGFSNLKPGEKVPMKKDDFKSKTIKFSRNISLVNLSRFLYLYLFTCFLWGRPEFAFERLDSIRNERF